MPHVRKQSRDSAWVGTTVSVDAEKGPDSEAAEFEHVGRRGGGGGGSDTGDRAQHFGAPAQAGIGLDGCLQVIVGGIDATFEGPALQRLLASGGLGSEFLILAAQGGKLVDEAPPYRH